MLPMNHWISLLYIFLFMVYFLFSSLKLFCYCCLLLFYLKNPWIRSCNFRENKVFRHLKCSISSLTASILIFLVKPCSFWSTRGKAVAKVYIIDCQVYCIRLFFFININHECFKYCIVLILYSVSSSKSCSTVTWTSSGLVTKESRDRFLQFPGTLPFIVQV